MRLGKFCTLFFICNYVFCVQADLGYRSLNCTTNGAVKGQKEKSFIVGRKESQVMSLMDKKNLAEVKVYPWDGLHTKVVHKKVKLLPVQDSSTYFKVSYLNAKKHKVFLKCSRRF